MLGIGGVTPILGTFEVYPRLLPGRLLFTDMLGMGGVTPMLGPFVV
jgi:hypothetical protein